LQPVVSERWRWGIGAVSGSLACRNREGAKPRAAIIRRAGLVTNSGPRGFSEILFAYASSVANKGQSMAGLNANTLYSNCTTAVAMLAGRFG